MAGPPLEDIAPDHETDEAVHVAVLLADQEAPMARTTRSGEALRRRWAARSGRLEEDRTRGSDGVEVINGSYNQKALSS